MMLEIKKYQMILQVITKVRKFIQRKSIKLKRPTFIEKVKENNIGHLKKLL